MIDVNRTYISADVGYCIPCEGYDVLTTYRDNETGDTYKECEGCGERTPVERTAPTHAP